MISFQVFIVFSLTSTSACVNNNQSRSLSLYGNVADLVLRTLSAISSYTTHIREVAVNTLYYYYI